MGKGPPSKPVRQSQKSQGVEETPPSPPQRRGCATPRERHTLVAHRGQIPSKGKAGGLLCPAANQAPPPPVPACGPTGALHAPPNWQENLPMGKGSGWERSCPDPRNLAEHQGAQQLDPSPHFSALSLALLQGGFPGHLPPNLKGCSWPPSQGDRAGWVWQVGREGSLVHGTEERGTGRWQGWERG